MSSSIGYRPRFMKRRLLVRIPYSTSFVLTCPKKKKLFKLLFLREMISALLVFFLYHPNCDMTFKITNRLKVNNSNFKFNYDFKN
jgi:hypothetical protein